MQWKFELLKKPTTVPLTEGPVWDGEQLLFTHIRASLILLARQSLLRGLTLVPIASEGAERREASNQVRIRVRRIP